MNCSPRDTLPVEEAVFITRPDQLPSLGVPYTRLYFGAESCQNHLPTERDLREVIEHARARGMDFTLVTPFVTDEGLQKVASLLAVAQDMLARFEVVVNDFGTLRLIRRSLPASRVSLRLGRLLTKQKRGPRLVQEQHRLPPQVFDHFQRTNVDVPALTALLATQAVEGIELDHPLQGLRRDSSGLCASLYHPFVLVTTGRFCRMNSPGDEQRPLRAIGPCRRECRSHAFSLTSPEMPVELLLKGSTIYYRHDALPDDLEALRITRLVHQPELPA